VSASLHALVPPPAAAPPPGASIDRYSRRWHVVARQATRVLHDVLTVLLREAKAAK
jgi:hypothetical protein